MACVDDSGNSIECQHAAGDLYIKQTPEQLELVPCPDEESQQAYQNYCLGQDAAALSEPCKRQDIRWCTSYSIETVGEGERLGFIPITNHCHDEWGRFSETAGGVVDTNSDGLDRENLVTCTFADGVTPVQRGSIEGDYAFCPTPGENCTGTFRGGFSSGNYDPRYRPWYINTKSQQKPLWHAPYPFFELGLGITYSAPVCNY